MSRWLKTKQLDITRFMNADVMSDLLKQNMDIQDLTWTMKVRWVAKRCAVLKGGDAERVVGSL